MLLIRPHLSPIVTVKRLTHFTLPIRNRYVTGVQTTTTLVTVTVLLSLVKPPNFVSKLDMLQNQTFGFWGQSIRFFCLVMVLHHYAKFSSSEGTSMCNLNDWLIEITVCLLNSFVFTMTLFRFNIECKGKHSHRSISICPKQLLWGFAR